jgi:YebC/PmpR family DNA-binding regulatory protein
MSGHSRWNNIKRKKEKSDAKKGKIFTKIGRELAVAVREGGPDVNSNSRLRECIAKAKSFNVPNENIERIIKKASGSDGCVRFESFSYESYGPCGTAFIVEVLTDNRNRTTSNLRRYFERNGGSLGTPGCVSFMFERKGVIAVENKNLDEEKLMEAAVTAGAQDFENEEDCFIITALPQDFENVKKELILSGYNLLSSDLEIVANSYVNATGENKAQIQKLIDILEDDDDIQNVWHNCEFEN